jgi:phage FluMu gp28-like protein
VAEAADAALTAAATHGQDVWYIGYNKDMAIEFILDVAQWTALRRGGRGDRVR